MNPDITYILNFEATQKERIIASLKEFCINTDEDNFDAALISADCSISFFVDTEETTKWYYELYENSRRIKGKIIIGIIGLWIEEKKDEIIFEFWAPASSTGKACLTSKNLYTAFVKLLESNNGFEIKLDHADGFIETIYMNPR